MCRADCRGARALVGPASRPPRGLPIVDRQIAVGRCGLVEEPEVRTNFAQPGQVDKHPPTIEVL